MLHRLHRPLRAPRGSTLGSPVYGRRYTISRWKARRAPQPAASWYIAKGAPHRAAAVEWVRFGSLPEQLAQLVVTAGSLPPHSAAAARPEWQHYAKTNTAIAVHVEAAKGAASYPPVPGWADACNVLATVISDALQGKATARAALADAARQADAAFAKARTG